MPNFFCKFVKKKMALSFLASVAEAYVDKYKDLSNILFVFPGRRAGTFFLKYLTQALNGRNSLLPKVSTMADFSELLSGRVVAGRIEMLFILYNAYGELLRNSGVKVIPEFDVFRKWGETALSDFNEVDMHDVDADAIFKNVKDLKEISTNFLNEEQLKVMSEFFGQAYDPEYLARGFWKSFNNSESDELHSKFRLLWQVLAPLYNIFRQKLEQKSLISPGGSYRLAADRLEEGLTDKIKANKVVMVGFNALTSSERRIFDALDKINSEHTDDTFADFFWDATGPVITDRTSTAGRFVQYNIRHWPAPDWALPFLKKSDVSEMPADIKVISVPSNSMQTKVIAEVLSNMQDRLPESDFEDTKVAVILPDEQLLIPMLYSLPDEIDDVNLTMGYPLKLSAIASFVSLLRRMQAGRRKSGQHTGYYFKDLNAVLSHPFSRVLFGMTTSKVKEWIAKHHKYIVDMMEVKNFAPDMHILLSPLSDNAGPQECAAWLDRILVKISEILTAECQARNKPSNVDVANIKVFRAALNMLLEVVEEYCVKMQWRTFLALTDRLLSSETVNFQGKPLRGLQVMGILETRALDFERVIIPSLNERILPARRRARTFISDSLRKAYGLPPVNYSESIFAYYFYRAISRAKEVVLLYDSRSSDGARSGDVSRYVLQLQYLYARDKMKIDSRTFTMSKSELKPSPIEKGPEVIEALNTYLDSRHGSSNLSATALNAYVECQLKFYFQHILKIKTDEESSEFIDAITQGSVVHDVMQAIYLPANLQHKYLPQPQVIDADLIQAKISDTKTIDTLIRHSINTRFYHLPTDDIDRPLRGSSAHVAKILRSQVLNILNFDLRQTPFLLYGVEMEGDVSLQLPDGRLVNMRYAIDRLDSSKVHGDYAQRDIKRIVDYKTGSVHVETDSMSSVFEGDYKGKNLLQLWLYANLFDALDDKNVSSDAPRPILKLFDKEIGLPREPLMLELYEVGKITTGHRVYPKVLNVVQYDHTNMNEEFLSQLELLMTGLFDYDQPFQPTSNERTCSFCPFKSICWR